MRRKKSTVIAALGLTTRDSAGFRHALDSTSTKGRAMSEITVLLERARSGDDGAWDEVVGLLYADLKRLARGAMTAAGPNTLSPTGLVHECYERLARAGAGGVTNRSHFFALAAQAMRQLLINHARDRVAAKRGGGAQHTTLGHVDLAADREAEDLLAIDDALRELAQSDERLVRIVECRVFAGLNDAETAEALNLSLRTAQRLWQSARDRLKIVLGEPE
ncbi:ECF-type sigma factor [Tahibacter amnicola]|uniref:ECF-type sigma factor n=1 Tax=Tahibacter amnicola TaxID=2976241 RepID=A0ABY6BAP9_9GAMM|nr:ECF-type sigma factor [Tahibacter amnicola]UXI66759.1 ECF-type sigma factor [Tahibacter amnicola]